MSLLLAVDIGNTSIAFGIFNKHRLIKPFRISSRLRYVLYRKELKRLLSESGISAEGIDGVIICSVAPKLTLVIEKALKPLLAVPPIAVGIDIKAPIKNNYKNPCQVGQDRLVDAVAAREIYGAPLIIVDSGTAITFDYISRKGEYEGGIIVPGIDISLKALFEQTALLPNVKLKDDRGLTLIGRDTVGSIKSGLLYGFGSLADGVISRIKESYGRDIKVIGTGGYIGFIKKYSNSIDIIDEFLTLKGLRIIYEKKYLTSGRL